MKNFFSRLLGKGRKTSREKVMQLFTQRYTSFKALLQANADVATIMATIEERLHDGNITSEQVQEYTVDAISHVKLMVTSLNHIANNRYGALDTAVVDIETRIHTELEEAKASQIDIGYCQPLSHITAAHAECVGGKAANLGEIYNVCLLPVPQGFAITIAACQAYIAHDNAIDTIHRILREVQITSPASITDASVTIQEILKTLPLPSDLESILFEIWDDTFAHDAQYVLTALRSSALREDGQHSFAGQYKTILGVRRDSLIQAFRNVVASLFSPQAIHYHLSHGYPIEQSLMAMVCLEMVDAVAAGVCFSRHPVDVESTSVVINGLWGLGELVVDGRATPDTWLVDRETLTITENRTAHKIEALHLHAQTGAVESTFVPPPLRDIPCLRPEQVVQVATLALELERHYHRPQDVEWAIDARGEVILLQSRPMRLADGRFAGKVTAQRVKHSTLLFEEGDTAAMGVGCGHVILMNDKDMLDDFPQGGILVTPHSSPKFSVIMDRAAAIIAETGSVTGHMASICREKNIPTLMNIPGITQKLIAGQTITVDAFSGRIYAGEVPELLELQHKETVTVSKSPAHAALRRVADHIVPLHLIDPKSALFAPQNCTSLHDVMRFVHEQSYTEMFRLSDAASDAGSVASRLKSRIPLDLYVIDLGGGLKNPESPLIYPEEVTSWPFAALLQGMLLPKVHATGPRPINMSGFMAVMSQSMIGGNNAGGERFGERSYAIISDRYMNFSSRVGYHYAILDTWCGNTINKNYITFKFAGGAADEVRRMRRVHCIGEILGALGFHIDIRGDSIQASFQKYPLEKTQACLDQVGRLLIVTRQMDMLMTSKEAIHIFAEKFMREEYH